MASNFEFTDKTEETVSAAVQLAKDYANAQVHPAHLAFALLNEGAGGEPPGGLAGNSQTSLFSSVIQKAGGDSVSTVFTCDLQYAILIHYFIDNNEARCAEGYRSHPDTEPPAR